MERRQLSSQGRPMTETSYTKMATDRPNIIEEHPRIKDTVGLFSQPMFKNYHSNMMSIDSNEMKYIESEQPVQTPVANLHDNRSHERRTRTELTIHDLHPSQTKYRFIMNQRTSHNSTANSAQYSDLQAQPPQSYQCEPLVVSKRQKQANNLNQPAARKHKKEKKEKKEKKHRRHQSSTSTLIESSQQELHYHQHQVQHNPYVPLHQDPRYQPSHPSSIAGVDHHLQHIQNITQIEHIGVKYKFDPSAQTAKAHNSSQASQPDYLLVQPFANKYGNNQSQSQLSSQTSQSSPHPKRLNKHKKSKKHKHKRHHENSSSDKKQVFEYQRTAPLRSLSPNESQTSSIGKKSALLDFKYAAQHCEKQFDEKVRSLKEGIKESLAELHLSTKAQHVVTQHSNSVQSAVTATNKVYRAHQRSVQARAQKFREEDNGTRQTTYTMQTEGAEPNANAQRYLKWLERNSQQQSRDQRGGSIQTVETIQESRETEEAEEERREMKRYKSVENVKQYCIQKLLGKLNTREELQIVSKNSLEKERRVDEEKYRSKYTRASDEINQRREVSKAKERLRAKEEAEQQRQLEAEYLRHQQAEQQRQSRARSKERLRAFERASQEVLHHHNQRPKDHSRNKDRQIKTQDEARRERSHAYQPSNDYVDTKVDVNPTNPSYRQSSKRSDLYVLTSNNSTGVKKPPLPDSKNYSFRPVPSQNYQVTEEDGSRRDGGFQKAKQFSFNGDRHDTAEEVKMVNVPTSIHNEQVSSLNVVYEPIHPYVRMSPSYGTDHVSSQQELSNHFGSTRMEHNQNGSYYTLGQVQNSHEQLVPIKLDKVDSNGQTSSNSTLARLEVIQSEEMLSEMTDQQRQYILNQTQHRIEQLKLQTAEIQRIPDHFNERVQLIKQRTAQITQQASPFRSRSRDYNATQPDDQRQSDGDNSNSFVKQNDLSSSFLRDIQFQNTKNLNNSDFRDLKSFKAGTQESANVNLSNYDNRSALYEIQPTHQAEHNPPCRNFNDFAENNLNNLTGMVNNLQREINHHQYNVHQVYSQAEQDPTQSFIQCDQSESRMSKHERRTKRKLRKERRRLLRKMRERGVYIPPEIEEMVEQSLLNSHSELGSCASMSFRNINGIPSDRLVQSTSQTQQTGLRKDSFTSTRKQLIYLMAIQNEHSRLLKEIHNQSGPHLGPEQSDKLNLASNNLMMQIQAIFQHLQDIQSKLEMHQIGSDQIQVQEQTIEEMTESGERHQQEQYINDEEEQVQPFYDLQDHEQVPVQLVPKINRNRAQRNERAAKATKQDNKVAHHDSESQRLVDIAHRQVIKNAYSKQNGLFSPRNKAPIDNCIEKRNASGNQYGLREHSDQTNSHTNTTLHTQKDLLTIKHSFEMQTQESENESRPNLIVNEYNDHNNGKLRQYGTQSLQNSNPFQTQTSMGTGSEKMTEAFCQMLNSEIEKIKHESVIQVNAMRDHYAEELKALREEFFAKEQELRIGKQQTITSEYEIRPSHQTSVKTATLNGSPRDSQVLMEELKNVKAERDTYYQKLVNVKERLRTSSLNRDKNIESIKTSLSRDKGDQGRNRVLVYESDQVTSNHSTFAPRHRVVDEYSQVHSNGIASQESFSYPIVSSKSNNKQVYFDRKPAADLATPAELYMRKDQSFNQLVDKQPDFKAQSFPQSHREPVQFQPHKFVVSPEVYKLKQQADPEEQQRTEGSEHEDDGGSIEKSFSHECYMDQISNGLGSSFRDRHKKQSEKKRSTRKRQGGRRVEKQELRSLSSGGSTRRSKSLSQRRQEAISIVMSNGLPSTVIDQHAFGLKNEQTVPVLPSKTSLNQIRVCGSCNTSNNATSSSQLRRSVSPKAATKKGRINRELRQEACSGCGKMPSIPTVSSAAESFKILRPDSQSKKRSQSPIMIDFHATKPPLKSPKRQTEYQRQHGAPINPRFASMRVSEANSLNTTQYMKANLVQTAGAEFNHSRNAIYDPTASGNQLNVTNSFGITLSTQNLALTLKEKEISERISRIESFLRNQV